MEEYLVPIEVLVKLVEMPGFTTSVTVASAGEWAPVISSDMNCDEEGDEYGDLLDNWELIEYEQTTRMGIQVRIPVDVVR